MAEYRGSYQYVGGEALIKRVSMARPVFQTTGPITVAFGVDVDFNNTALPRRFPAWRRARCRALPCGEPACGVAV